MVILKMIFSRTLAFFGAAEVIVAGVILWGLTQLITPASVKKRLIGLFVVILALIVAVIVALIGYRFSIK